MNQPEYTWVAEFMENNRWYPWKISHDKSKVNAFMSDVANPDDWRMMRIDEHDNDESYDD
jgi:hypothetical protein